MLNLPIFRWGKPYTSLEQDSVVHFISGETLAKVSLANPGIIGRDMHPLVLESLYMAPPP